ncbi:hypothetical protein [Prauserella endophytica]|uniref:Uncharacterized protein n=1 Tax=Prauserella endophytica TaxID=1592324 RepID=A0ABY2S0A2_9PSEU|nr:hypothetical protein [Prauserella endophytica]TKG67026.1 hypothetical protein FCN18_24275 [Prauserella endophytica]
MANNGLGDWLNTPELSLSCPRCGKRAAMDVFEHACRWRCCGFERALPALHGGLGWRGECKVCAERHSKQVAA